MRIPSVKTTAFTATPLAVLLLAGACAAPETEPITDVVPSTRPNPTPASSPVTTTEESLQARIGEIDEAYPGAAEFIATADEQGWDQEFASTSWMDSPHIVAEYAPADNDFPALLYALSALAELEDSAEESEYMLFQSVRNHDLYVDGVQRDVVAHATETFAPELAEHVDPMITRLEDGFPGSACVASCVVGEDIEPGTYEATLFGEGLFVDAYWEVTSPDGEIVSNNFVTSAQMVTVTIPAHAGQFTERGFGLGFWVKVA